MISEKEYNKKRYDERRSQGLCTKCGKPSNGMSRCPECTIKNIAKCKLYHEKHREQVDAINKLWYENHREQKAAYNKAYNKENKEQIAIIHKLYRNNHKEYDKLRYKRDRDNRLLQRAKYVAAHKEPIAMTSKIYYENHREQKAIIHKSWYEKNKEYVMMATKLWCKKHPELRYERKKRHEARKCGAQICDFTIKQWTIVKELWNYRCAYCGREGIELTRDHVFPLELGGNHTMANIVPACRSCNSAKGAKFTPEFAAILDKAAILYTSEDYVV